MLGRSVLWLALLTFATALVARVPAARACSVCETGDPLVHAGDSVARSARLRLALDFQYLTASAASDDMPGATESVDQLTLQPVIVYSPLPQLNLVLQAPLMRKHWTLTGAGADEEQAPIGLGDLDLGARWFVWQREDWLARSRQALGLTAGVYLPTGADGAQSDGERIDDHAQLGRGSLGPYVGASYAYHRDPWNTFASITVTAHTTNAYDYHYGAGLQWTVREDFRPWDRIAFELGADGRYAARDDIAGERQENTGGLVLAVAPGLAVNVAGDLWLRARGEIPVYERLYGTQRLGVTMFTSVELAMP